MRSFFVIYRAILEHLGEPSNTGRGDRTTRLNIEPLEQRVNFAADVEAFDGTGNNLLHPDWGSAGSDFLRIAPATYADGISAPAGADRPSARDVSNVLAAHPTEDTINQRDLSAFIYAWGQFLDHDLDLTMTQTPAEPFNIAVPTGDPYFDPAATGTQVIGLTRSQYDSATGLGVGNARQQVNSITAFIDGSQIYGSDAATAASLRTFSGGKLRTSSGNLLPVDAGGFFQAGDIRVNENIELISMQTLFMREHNRLADQISKGNASLTDEQVFQQARKIVIGELQAITYGEFLPALLGGNVLKPYSGYKAEVNPGIANEFAAAAFRFGHSMLGSDVEFLDNDGNEIREAVSLRDAFFNPGLVKETGVDAILKYLASDRAEELDTLVVDDVRNFLFGPPGAGGLDLASLNIQRGRDHGLPDYNSLRAAYGLKRVISFAEITPDKELQSELQRVYGSVDKIDAWVGGLAEKHVHGGSMGELFSRILIDQFTRLRDGDRFWFQNQFSKDQIRQIEQTTLADVIRRNTALTNLQSNVFFFKTSISGTVFNDADRNSILSRGEQGLAGINVRLLDATGAVVAATRTDAQGHYRFSGLDLGKYRVQSQGPDDAQPTTTAQISLTRGMEIKDINVGLTKGKQQSGPKAPPPASPPMCSLDQIFENYGAPDPKKPAPPKR
jgi:hypothetical protein